MISAPPQIPGYAQNFARRGESAGANLWHGLQAAWHMSLGPTGRTLFDQSGYGNHGTLMNMDPATDWVMTEKGWALDFGAGGNNHHVDLTGLIVGSTYTMTGLIYSTDSSSANRYLFDSQTGRTVLAWGSDTAGKIGLYDGTSWRLYGNSPSADVWHHIAVVCDGNTSKTRLYLDGQLYGSESDWTPCNLGGAVSLGSRYEAYGGNWYGFAGHIASWHVFACALTPAEIMQLCFDPAALFRYPTVPPMMDGLPAVSDRPGRGVLTGGRM